jgi:hypothetical protein
MRRPMGSMLSMGYSKVLGPAQAMTCMELHEHDVGLIFQMSWPTPATIGIRPGAAVWMASIK